MKHRTRSAVVRLAALTTALAAAGETATAQVLHKQKISATEGGFDSPLVSNDAFGRTVAGIGDLDGDGLSELAVGEPCGDNGGFNRGAVWILFLRPDGTVRRQQEISTGRGGFTGTIGNRDIFGNRITALGDRDGDGVPDILVGAPLHDAAGRDAGTAWILYLTPAGTVRAHAQLLPPEGGFPGLAFGRGLGGLGDLDGDGVRDIAVGAPLTDDGVPDGGAVWIFFMNADGTERERRKISATSGGFTGRIDFGVRFGDDIADLGDLDGDGVLDLAVGSSSDNDGAGGAGAIWVLFMNRDGTVKGHQKISATEGGLVSETPYVNDEFGITVEAADIDGDGRREILTGAINEDDGGENSGSAYVLFLNTDGTVRAQIKISNRESDFGFVIDPLDRFGNGVTSLGDLDGNGVPDLAIGAPCGDDGGRRVGEVWVVFLDCVTDPSRADLRFGSGVNPACLARFHGPTLGNEWMVLVEAPGGTPTWVAAYDRPAAGFPTPFGEVLVRGRPLVTGFAVSGGRTARHRFPVPFDPGLLGMELFAQALVLGQGSAVLCNAIDARVGCF